MTSTPDTFPTGSVLDLVYQAAVDPERWTQVLEELSSAFHAHAILYMQDLRSGRRAWT